MRTSAAHRACALLALAACSSSGIDPCRHGSGALVRLGPGSPRISTVFVIVMENKSWAEIRGNPSAPFINGTLVPQASIATQYSGTLHPSEPNYLWLEGGTTYGIGDDDDPASHHLANHDHLVSLLGQAGIPWKAYEEGVDGTSCPLRSAGRYAAKHDPFVFFDDVTGELDPQSPACIAHVRPLGELAADLESGAVPRYVFVTPDLCNDMHDSSGCATPDSVANGDAFLAEWIPRIQAWPGFAQSAVFIVWDENEGGNDPIPLVILSPAAKGGGYGSAVAYSHSSTLRTVQEIFGVGPLLCDAAAATPLSDLFQAYP